MVDCEIVEASIINIQTETSVWFLIKQYGGTCKRLKRLNKPHFQMGLM